LTVFPHFFEILQKPVNECYKSQFNFSIMLLSHDPIMSYDV